MIQKISSFCFTIDGGPAGLMGGCAADKGPTALIVRLQRRWRACGPDRVASLLIFFRRKNGDDINFSAAV